MTVRKAVWAILGAAATILTLLGLGLALGLALGSPDIVVELAPTEAAATSTTTADAPVTEPDADAAPAEGLDLELCEEIDDPAAGDGEVVLVCPAFVASGDTGPAQLPFFLRVLSWGAPLMLPVVAAGFYLAWRDPERRREVLWITLKDTPEGQALLDRYDDSAREPTELRQVKWGDDEPSDPAPSLVENDQT